MRISPSSFSVSFWAASIISSPSCARHNGFLNRRPRRADKVWRRETPKKTKAGTILSQEDHDKRWTPTCSECSSKLLQPVEWVRIDDLCWAVAVRCPECGAEDQLVLGKEEVCDFSRAMERAFQLLVSSLYDLDHELFEAESNAFIDAIWNDRIYPADF